MKNICKKCLIRNKTKESCQKRGCIHAPVKEIINLEIEKPIIYPELVIIIPDIQLKICGVYDEWFVAQVIKLKDISKSRGHFGSYIKMGRFYRFNLISNDEEDKIWEIPEEGTEKFHRDGETSSQFLLYWNKQSEFSIDLDS